LPWEENSFVNNQLKDTTESLKIEVSKLKRELESLNTKNEES
jgi:hypothetical protein